MSWASSLNPARVVASTSPVQRPCASTTIVPSASGSPLVSASTPAALSPPSEDTLACLVACSRSSAAGSRSSSHLASLAKSTAESPIQLLPCARVDSLLQQDLLPSPIPVPAAAGRGHAIALVQEPTAHMHGIHPALGTESDRPNDFRWCPACSSALICSGVPDAGSGGGGKGGPVVCISSDVPDACSGGGGTGGSAALFPSMLCSLPGPIGVQKVLTSLALPLAVKARLLHRLQMAVLPRSSRLCSLPSSFLLSSCCACLLTLATTLASTLLCPCHALAHSPWSSGHQAPP